MVVFDLFLQGGLVMWPLLLCSIVALAILFERLRTYNRAESDMERYRSNLPGLAAEADWEGILELCSVKDCIVGRVISSAVRTSRSVERQTVLVEAAALTEAAKLRAYLRYLETIVTLAPLLGLLGTVTGMISSFNVLSVSEGQPFAITGGVGEALVATAAGLLVAILALVIHTYLTQRQDSLISDMEEAGTLYLASLEAGRYEG